MSDFNGDLDALIQEKLDGDTEFIASLDSVDETEREQLISEKKKELLAQEFLSIQEKAKKAEEIAKNQEIRAKKAEAAAKKPQEKETPKNDLSLKDIRALQDVHDDDVDDVVEYAKFKGVTIAEAKNSSVIQSLLKTRLEERKTAETIASTTRSKVGGVSTEKKVLADFEKGITPTTEDESAALAAAQFEKLLKGTK